MLNVKDMELRDWFAGQALNALIGRERGGELPASTFQHLHHAHTAVHEAYVYADEMMTERAQQRRQSNS
jgi:hypothetical protein